MKPPAANATRLALDRTVMASERTLMAWVRTSISLMGFGFTIYKFLEGFSAQRGGAPGREPRTVGLILIGMGLIAMLFAILQHGRFMHQIGERLRPFPLLFTTLLWLLGAAAFVNVLVG
jgi:putative membrane protein